jgi:transcription initiation factor IIE alpha subunit
MIEINTCFVNGFSMHDIDDEINKIAKERWSSHKIDNSENNYSCGHSYGWDVRITLLRSFHKKENYLPRISQISSCRKCGRPLTEEDKTNLLSFAEKYKDSLEFFFDLLAFYGTFYETGHFV